MKKKRRRREEGEQEDGSRRRENKGLDKNEMQPRGMGLVCVLVPTWVHAMYFPYKWPTTGTLIIIPDWDKPATGCPLSSLYARGTNYEPECSPQTCHHNGVWQKRESYQAFIIELGVCDLHLRQPLCMRVFLHSICSPQDEEEFGRSGVGGSTIDLVGCCGGTFGAMLVTGVKSAGHRQLNCIIRHQAVTPPLELMREPDRGEEQSRDWGGREIFFLFLTSSITTPSLKTSSCMTFSNSDGSPLMSMCTTVTAIPITDI